MCCAAPEKLLSMEGEVSAPFFSPSELINVGTHGGWAKVTVRSGKALTYKLTPRAWSKFNISD